MTLFTLLGLIIVPQSHFLHKKKDFLANGWDEESFTKLISSLEHLDSSSFVVLDADGTLWSKDVGDGFLQFLDKKPELSPNFDLWANYQKLLQEDELRAFRYCTQVLAGLNEATVCKLCEEYCEVTQEHQPVAPIKILLEALSDLKIDAWVVSASNQWIVRAMVKKMYPGLILEDRVFGVDLAISAGRLTSDCKEPFPYREGKLARLQQNIAKRAWIAVGDSAFDLELLDSAILPIVLHWQDKGDLVSELAEYVRDKQESIYLQLS